MIDYIQNFIVYLNAEKNYSKNTIKSYQADLHDFKYFVDNKKLNIIEINHNDLNNWLKTIKNTDIKKTTLSRKISSLRSFYKFLCHENIIEKNPVNNLKNPKMDSNIPNYISINEITKLFKTVKDKNDIESLRDYCCLSILYTTGIRVSELINIKISDIDDGEYITIFGKNSKERIVPIYPQTLTVIKKYISKAKLNIKNDSCFLFPSQKKINHPITRQRVFQIIKNRAVQANLDHEKLSPHKLRHAYATHMLESGVELIVLQQLLGHSDISSTQIYTNISDKKLKTIINEKHPLG